VTENTELNAWPEGSRHPRYPVWTEGEADFWEVEIDERGFNDFTYEHHARYPLLAYALAHKGPPTKTTEIKMLMPPKEEGGLEYTVSNYCQIVRCPGELRWPGGGGAQTIDELRERQFEEMCHAMERTLWDGKAHDGRVGLQIPLRYCGGVRDLLGRDPVPGDVIALRFLREPVWRVSRYLGDPPQTIGEWIVEFTLVALPTEAS
jgi:hypothetical protein